MYGSKGGNAWKSLPILTEGRRFESCHSEKHIRPVLRIRMHNLLVGTDLQFTCC